MIIILDHDQHLVDENRRLKQQVLDIQKEIESVREEINMYQEQLKTMKKDFQQEHLRSVELEHELSGTKKKLDRTERELMYNFAEKRRLSLENYENEYYKKIYGKAAKEQLHRIDEKCEDVVDSLECPKCEKPYPAKAHDELLEHYDECVEQCD